MGSYSPVTKPHNWRFSILPYMEQSTLYQQGKTVAGSDVNFWEGHGNSWNGDTLLFQDAFLAPIYICPSSPLSKIVYANGEQGQGAQTIHYVGIMGAYPDPISRTDNVSYEAARGSFATNTGCLLIGEHKAFRHILDGVEANAQYDWNTPLSSDHPGGVHVLLADGSVRSGWDTLSVWWMPRQRRWPPAGQNQRCRHIGWCGASRGKHSIHV